MATFFTLTSFLLTLYLVQGLNQYRPPTRQFRDKWLSQEVPGLEYISRGYNIMFGNPHTTGNVDGGIMGEIFNLQNTSNGRTYQNYTVPNGVSVLPSPTCLQSFTYNAITGSNSYSKSLTQSTSFDLKVFKAAFSASVDYQSVYKSTTTQKSVFTSSYTQCACFSANLNLPYDLPAFTDNFYETISNLPNKYNNKNESNLQFFYNFFTKYFGTHYITQLTMGGIFGTLSSMKSFSYSTFSSSNLDIKVSASCSTIAASAAASSQTDTEKTQASDFDSISTSKKVFNIGGNLPANNNAGTWQQELSANPLPISYTFDVIPNLLTSQYFPKIKDISKKKSALQSALNDYCTQIAVNNTFGVIDCNGYPPDPNIPADSIVKGFYASNVDSEPKNPYTDGYSCNDGFEPIEYASYCDIKSTEFSAYFCNNATMNKKDGLSYFGGFYENCVNEDDSGGVCNKENYYTGKCSCPSGYVAIAASEGWSKDYKSNCPHVYNNYLTPVQVFLCYNSNISLTETIMGGMFSNNSDSSDCGAGWPNAYTKTTSCPTGFTAYHVSTQCCYIANDVCSQTHSAYVCLNNIYPV